MVTSRSSEDLANNVFIDVESSRGQYHNTVQSHNSSLLKLLKRPLSFSLHTGNKF